MTTPTPADDLDAVRTITAALAPFAPEDQRRILRWAQEKLGLAVRADRETLPPAKHEEDGSPRGLRDIRSFLQEKQPASDIQFAAAVAYYFAFEATPAERAEEISASALRDAARLSGRVRLAQPIVTLNNAVKRGYLDRGKGRGTFRINTVGENLVAMAMPGANAGTADRKQRTRKAKAAKPARKSKK